MGALAFDLEECLKAVLRLEHVKALEADVLTDYGTHLGIVIDDEHGLRSGVLRNGRLLGVSGRSTVRESRHRSLTSLTEKWFQRPSGSRP